MVSSFNSYEEELTRVTCGRQIVTALLVGKFLHCKHALFNFPSEVCNAQRLLAAREKVMHFRKCT